MVGSRPMRSASTPNTGDSANIPAMCRLRVKPTTDRDAPSCTRCTGVIDINAIIVAWLSASVMIATRTNLRSPAPVPGTALVPAAASDRRRLSSRGSGRIQTR